MMEGNLGMRRDGDEMSGQSGQRLLTTKGTGLYWGWLLCDDEDMKNERIYQCQINMKFVFYLK